jgi:hypothetical protein
MNIKILDASLSSRDLGNFNMSSHIVKNSWLASLFALVVILMYLQPFFVLVSIMQINWELGE